VLAHDPFNPLAADGLTLGPQFGVDARRSVSFPVLCMDPPDVDQQRTGRSAARFRPSLAAAICGSAITSDAGLLPYRELDDTLGLTDTGANTLADPRIGKNGRHRLVGLLRQSYLRGWQAMTT
jgi:hypothetical protein